MSAIKQRATIVSIDHLNKNFEVKITNCPAAHYASSGGDVLLPLPENKVGDYFEIGDVIEFKKLGKKDFKIINLTCVVLKLSKFKRDFISTLRCLDNENHPLKRRILLNEAGFVLLSAKKNPEKLMLLHNQQETEDNHEIF